MTKLTAKGELEDTETRMIKMPDNTQREVCMLVDWWEIFDCLKVVEGITEPEVAEFALQEILLQGITFDEAYCCIVAHFRNRWTP